MFSPWMWIFKTTCVCGQLPSEVNLWSQEQKQFMQNSKVCKSPAGERHSTISVKKLFETKLLVSWCWPFDWISGRNISQSTCSRPPFSLICPAEWKHWFLEFGYLADLMDFNFPERLYVRNTIKILKPKHSIAVGVVRTLNCHDHVLYPCIDPLLYVWLASWLAVCGVWHGILAYGRKSADRTEHGNYVIFFVFLATVFGNLEVWKVRKWNIFL